MVLRSVHKTYGLVGLLVATVAVPTACSDADFEGCKASRTCPSQGGENSGSGGEAGGAAETGGSSGSSSGTSGAAGMDDGGSGGTGGSSGSGASGGEGGADDEPPTVEAFTPSDGSVDVERDIEVTAELSEPIDEATVTETSVTLVGPDGEVAGTLGVDGNVISFVPDRPLYLLGTYTLTLDDTIADLAGNTLEEPASAEFQVRDGRWSEPTFPFGETEPRNLGRHARNSFGDLLIGGTTNHADTRPWAAIYEAAENRWSVDEDIRSMTSTDLYVFDLAIDDERRAALTWGGYALDGGGWYRYTDGGGWVDAGAQTTNSYVAITNSGLAVSVWGYGPDLLGQTQDIAEGTVQSVMRIGAHDRSVYALVPSRERVAMFTRLTSSANTLHVTWYDPGVGWGTPEPLATSADVGMIAAESDALGNMVAIWTQGAEIWSRVYDRAEGQWTQAMLVTTLDTPDTFVSGLALDMEGGNVIATFGVQLSSIWAAYYEHEVGWIQASIREIAGPIDYSWGSVATLDRAGNALIVWGEDEFRARRYVPGQGWLAESPHEVGLNPHAATCSPDRSVTMVGWSMGPNGFVPAFTRFE